MTAPAPHTTEQLIRLLDEAQVHYQRFFHPPVFTCEEARALCPDLPGAETKNLFLRDGKGKRHFLITVPDHASVNLKQLGERLEVKGLTFASPERLLRYLGITPGAVSLLALVNDIAAEVEVILDTALAEAAHILSHPLVNTETLSVETGSLLRFLREVTRHEVAVMALTSPAQATECSTD